MQKTKNALILNFMDYIHNIIEYYDELYPVSEDQKKLFSELIGERMPARILRVGCSTGFFEHQLARAGHDVTGIETSKEMIETASRRRRMPNTAIRFFQMSTIEMTRFLGKKFYNVISCLNDKLLFVHDRTLMRKFFYDCKSLLADEGHVLLQIPNFSSVPEHGTIRLPVRESIRVRLDTSIEMQESGEGLMTQTLDHSGTKPLPVLKDVAVFPLTKNEIESFSKEAGFTSVEFFADYAKNPLLPESPYLLAILS